MNSIITRPIISLLNQLNFTIKFTLIFVLFLMPIAYFSYSKFDELSDRIQVAEKEKLGIEYLISLRPIYTNMAKTRGMTNAFLNGEVDLETKIKSMRDKIEKYFSNLEAVDASLSSILKTKGKVSDIIERWQKLQHMSFSLSAEKSFAEHTFIIEKALDLNEHIIESSGLILDSNVASHFLMDASFLRLPVLMENMGKARGVGSGIAAKGNYTPESFLQLVNYVDTINVTLKKMNHALQIVFNEDSEYASKLALVSGQADKEVKEFIMLSKNSLINPVNIKIEAVDYFDGGSKAIKSVVKLFDAIIPILNSDFTQQINSYKAEITAFIVFNFILLMTMLYIFVGFYMGLMISINQIGQFVNEVANGNLTSKIKLKTNDEIKNIANDLNIMVEKVNFLVSQVISNANIVASSANESSLTANGTMQGVNAQNSEIDQVVTAMNEMSATVHEVAKNASSTSNATQHADEQTNNGRKIVLNAIESIDKVSLEMKKVTDVVNKLEGDSGKIGTVLEVIKSIAEQTNLLALNAAIEAARAGEQGRGFAVVADEVRTLASRTQTSTSEIHDIIEIIQQGASNAVDELAGCNEQTDLAVKKANEAGSALEEITLAVDEISQMNFQIASAAEEQSQVAEEINRNIVNVSNIACDTVKGAETTVENSNALKAVAEKMQGIVSEFKV